MLWQPRHPFDEPDAITQTAVFDLRDSSDLTAYNALLAADGHTIRVTDTDTKYVQEKATFDRNGIELDRIPEKYLTLVTFKVRPGAKLPPGANIRLPSAANTDDEDE